MTYLLIFLAVSALAYAPVNERRHATRSGNLGLAALIGVAGVALFILLIAGKAAVPHRWLGVGLAGSVPGDPTKPHSPSNLGIRSCILWAEALIASAKVVAGEQRAVTVNHRENQM